MFSLCVAFSLLHVPKEGTPLNVSTALKVSAKTDCLSLLIFILHSQRASSGDLLDDNDVSKKNHDLRFYQHVDFVALFSPLFCA